MPEPKSNYRFGLRMHERGSIIGVGDGIAWVKGLPSARMDELLVFADGSQGLVFQLNEKAIGVIILMQTHNLTAGMAAQCTGRMLTIGTSDALLGRVIDPLGNPLDGLAAPETLVFAH